MILLEAGLVIIAQKHKTAGQGLCPSRARAGLCREQDNSKPIQIAHAGCLPIQSRRLCGAAVYRACDRSGDNSQAPYSPLPRPASLPIALVLMTPASKSTFVLGHRHLLGIEGLSAADITGLLDLSEEYVELNRQVDRSEERRVGKECRSR